MGGQYATLKDVAERAGTTAATVSYVLNGSKKRYISEDMRRRVEEAARELMAKYGISKIVVSMGGDGALYVTEKESVYAEGLKVPVGSTVGAGDSVVAALAVAEESGMSLEETVRLSTATGAANVMCSGTQAAEYDVIKSLIPKVVFHRR